MPGTKGQYSKKKVDWPALSQLAKEVLHITCNTGTCDLPDMYAINGPRALGIHISSNFRPTKFYMSSLKP